MEIKTLDISKSYRGIQVVKGVSVSLKKGEIVGLLGPNGAGKTTTFDIIVGLITPDAGEVFHNEKLKLIVTMISGVANVKKFQFL